MVKVYMKEGFLVTELDAPRWIEKLPSYGRWTRFLLANGYAVKDGQFEGDDGKLIDIIRPLEHAVGRVLENGHTVIPCICCGFDIDQDDAFVKRRTGLVTVGGLIKTQDKEVTEPGRMTIRWIARPVSKRGMGCQTCQARMLKAIEDVSAINRERMKQATLLAQIALIEADILRAKGVEEKKIGKLTTKKLPGALGARIDIFDAVMFE